PAAPESAGTRGGCRDRDRGDRHAGHGRSKRRGAGGRGGGPLATQLRAGGRDRSRGGNRSEGGPCRRAADPRLLRAAWRRRSPERRQRGIVSQIRKATTTIVGGRRMS